MLFFKKRPRRRGGDRDSMRENIHNTWIQQKRGPQMHKQGLLFYKKKVCYPI